MGSSGLWMGSAGLSSFFVFEIINRDGQHKVPAAVNAINRSGHLMLPAAVIPFSAAGTDARHSKATINRDLSFVADANARCGKCKVAVMVNSCVVVVLTLAISPTPQEMFWACDQPVSWILWREVNTRSLELSIHCLMLKVISFIICTLYIYALSFDITPYL